jgi:hypothetical protein
MNQGTPPVTILGAPQDAVALGHVSASMAKRVAGTISAGIGYYESYQYYKAGDLVLGTAKAIDTTVGFFGKTPATFLAATAFEQSGGTTRAIVVGREVSNTVRSQLSQKHAAFMTCSIRGTCGLR